MFLGNEIWNISDSVCVCFCVYIVYGIARRPRSSVLYYIDCTSKMYDPVQRFIKQTASWKTKRISGKIHEKPSKTTTTTTAYAKHKCIPIDVESQCVITINICIYICMNMQHIQKKNECRALSAQCDGTVYVRALCIRICYCVLAFFSRKSWEISENKKNEKRKLNHSIVPLLVHVFICASESVICIAQTYISENTINTKMKLKRKTNSFRVATYVDVVFTISV